MKLSHQTIELKPTHPFVIARGGYAHHRNVIVRLTDDDGMEGFGEAAPNRYYGESVATVIAALGQFKPILERVDPMELESIEAHLSRVLRGNASAKSAVSSALHDLVGKRLGLPVFRIWGLDGAAAPQSSFTIAIAESHELEQRVAEAREYPILKIKLGTDRDMEIVRIVRNAAPEKRLRVDANAAWTAKHAVKMSEFLADQGVEMLEQPVPASDIEGLRFRRRILPRRDRHCQTRGSGRWDQHQACQVWKPARSAADGAHRARPRHAGDGWLHDRKLAGDIGDRSDLSASRLRRF
jgi:L-Ala-D/L-Glu epimerase